MILELFCFFYFNYLKYLEGMLIDVILSKLYNKFKTLYLTFNELEVSEVLW